MSINPNKLVSKKELKTVYGIPYSPQHIARLEKAGNFPARIKLSPYRVAWFALSIEEWIKSKLPNSTDVPYVDDST